MAAKPRQSSRSKDVSDLIHRLGSLSLAELRDLWHQTFPSPPFSTHPEVLIPVLAHRLQEASFGGLSRSTRARLADLADAAAAGRSPGYALSPRIKAGTRLVRSWGGDVHEVTVVDGGYLYREVTYDSLSVIAGKITGTHWSGPRFFGLTQAAGSKAAARGAK